MTYTFALETSPSDEEVLALHAGLREFNRPFVPAQGEGPLAILLRDEQGALAGGLLGYSYWGWLCVEILWLSQAARGQGYGSRMLEMAEQEAARRGCRHAFLDTTTWQAQPFYERHGYTVWGRLDDFPPGQARIFMKKAL